MLSIEKNTDIGSYEIYFEDNTSSKNSDGKLKFSQSSRSGKIEVLVNIKDYEHNLKDRNAEKLKALKEKHQIELDAVVSSFHNEVEELMKKIAVDLENLK